MVRGGLGMSISCYTWARTSSVVPSAPWVMRRCGRLRVLLKNSAPSLTITFAKRSAYWGQCQSCEGMIQGKFTRLVEMALCRPLSVQEGVDRAHRQERRSQHGPHTRHYWRWPHGHVAREKPDGRPAHSHCWRSRCRPGQSRGASAVVQGPEFSQYAGTPGGRC